MSPNSIAYIDRSALLHNLRQLKAHAPHCAVLAMVKSNAYGHGAITVAKTIANEVEGFGVVCLAEALELKAAGIQAAINSTKPICKNKKASLAQQKNSSNQQKISSCLNKLILITMGFCDTEELQLIAQNGFAAMIHNAKQLQILEKTPLKNKLQVWLKINTGMHRLGFPPEQVAAVYQRLLASEKVLKPITFSTHFSDANDATKTKTSEQIALFNQVTAPLEGLRSLANSAAIFQFSEACIDWLRPGISLYGISPFAKKTAQELGLKPVMTLTSRIIAIQEIEKGAAVGYGSAWVAPEKMRIGIVAIGYGDGYARHTKNGAPVLVNGKRCLLIGRVAMDMITIDLRPNPQAKIGDQVILWGKGLPIEEIAAYADTLPHELFCRLTKRVCFK